MRAYQTFQRRVLQEWKECFEDEVAHIRACRLFLQRFTVGLFTLLSQFHGDLTEHYLQYQRQYPKDSCIDGQAKYRFRPMDTIDMQDPTNAKRLTDYSLFERDYTLERKPVAFTNVDLTKSANYTLDFLLKNCGFMNVTDSVRTSNHVAGTQQFNEQAPPEWGGLKNYRLPTKFMTWDRISGKSSPDGKMPDRDLTFSDFVELASKI